MLRLEPSYSHMLLAARHRHFLLHSQRVWFQNSLGIMFYVLYFVFGFSQCSSQRQSAAHCLKAGLVSSVCSSHAFIHVLKPQIAEIQGVQYAALSSSLFRILFTHFSAVTITGPRNS